MELKFKATTSDKKTTELPLRVTDTVLINFSRCIKNEEYSLTFVNDKGYENLHLIFATNLEIDCYFEYIRKTGKSKFCGYKFIKDTEKISVCIKDCGEFTIYIPREKNTDVCVALTLLSLEAE